MQALIERDGSLLLECRSDCGRWGLIGGSIGVGESLEDALRREVFEETGLEVREHKLFCVLSDPSRIIRYPDGNVRRIISFAFRVEVETFETLQRSEESEELRFVEPEELKKLDIIETARPIIQEYLSGDVSRVRLMD